MEEPDPPHTGDAVPAASASACPDVSLAPATREGAGGAAGRASRPPSPGPEGAGAARPQEGSRSSLRAPPADPQRVRPAPELVRPRQAMDGLGRERTDGLAQVGRLPGEPRFGARGVVATDGRRLGRARAVAAPGRG